MKSAPECESGIPQPNAEHVFVYRKFFQDTKDWIYDAKQHIELRLHVAKLPIPARRPAMHAMLVL
jgi:hypothetical protein